MKSRVNSLGNSNSSLNLLLNTPSLYSANLLSSTGILGSRAANSRGDSRAVHSFGLLCFVANSMGFVKSPSFAGSALPAEAELQTLELPVPMTGAPAPVHSRVEEKSSRSCVFC